MHSGMATQFGPDIAKATIASKNIFKIIDHPTKINASDKKGENSKIRLNPSEIKGKIEFKNVWFRYPTRKE